MAHTTRAPRGCLVALVCLSAYLAVMGYPYFIWRFGAAFGFWAFISLFLRVGWIVPCTLAGVYLGALLDPPVKGGGIDSQMNETVGYIIFGTLIGLFAGVVADAWPDPPASSTTPAEPSSESAHPSGPE